MFDIVVIGGGASANAFLLGVGNERRLALVAPITVDVPGGLSRRAFSWPRDVSPKLKVPKIQKSATEWLNNFPHEVELDEHFTYLAFPQNGSTRYWGTSMGVLDPADMDELGLECREMMRAYRALVRSGVPYTGNVDDALAPAHGKLPRSDHPYRSPLIAKMDGTYARHRVRVGSARNAVHKVGPLACTGLRECLNGCRRGALWSPDVRAVLREKQGSYFCDGWAKRIHRVEGGFSIDVTSGKSLQTIKAKQVVLAVDPLTAFALLAPLVGVEATAEIWHTPAMAWAALSSRRTAPGAGFSLAQSMVEWRPNGRVEAFGHIFEGRSLEKGQGNNVGGSKLVESIFRFALPNLVLGNLFFRGRPGALLTFDPSAGIKMQALAASEPPGARSVAKDIRSFCLANFLVPVATRFASPGSDLHFAGGVPRQLITDKAHYTGIEGLYVVGGAAFRSLPPQSPTFSFMAAAYLLGHSLGKEK